MRKQKERREGEGEPRKEQHANRSQPTGQVGGARGRHAGHQASRPAGQQRRAQANAFAPVPIWGREPEQGRRMAGRLVLVLFLSHERDRKRQRRERARGEGGGRGRERAREEQG